jgi:hypothetical protein
MKFGIVGNCQVRGLRECLTVLAPGHAFEAIQVEQLQADDQATLTRIVALAEDADVLFTHLPDFSVAATGPQQALRQALSLARPRTVVTIPSIVFGGFHPDCCVLGIDGKYLQTAAYNYHSAIIAGAYLCGLPAARVPALFNRFVYAGLGYVGDFARHGTGLLESFATLGFDAGFFFASRRVFMHCPNHPMVDALFELARQMLERVRVQPVCAPPPEDWMSTNALLWPVYPGLVGARRSEGDDVSPGTALNVVHGTRVIPWGELIESSYACYAEHHLENANWYAPSVARAAGFLGEHVKPERV